jgi:hypothetical protein
MAAVARTDAGTRERGGIGLYGWTALLLVLEVILQTVPIVVLGAAIDWPASLDEPASVNLPLITEQRGAVILGYGSYLLYSVLILPLAFLLYRVLADREGPTSPLLTIAVGFGVVSTLARSLGIVRWLFMMPVLAGIYLDPDASEATRQMVSVTYEAFNSYAGGIGEILGVGLFGAALFGLISVALVRSARFPSWIGYAGLVVAALLSAGVLEVFGIDLGPFLAISVTALQLWMLALAVVLFRSRRARKEA